MFRSGGIHISVSAPRSIAKHFKHIEMLEMRQWYDMTPEMRAAWGKIIVTGCPRLQVFTWTAGGPSTYGLHGRNTGYVVDVAAARSGTYKEEECTRERAAIPFDAYLNTTNVHG